MDVKINTNAKKTAAESEGTFAVVYARYSSRNQTEQSIEGQLAAAHAYAEIKGYTIIHEYIDRAMTGRNDNRDDFQQMLSDCAKHQFQVIIVWKVDRFGRNREEITFNKYRAKRHGVRVEYVAENLPESPEGVILESVLEGMAEYYSLQLSQNVKRGLRENFKKGKVIGGHVPFGYRISADKMFEVNPKTAPFVRWIFDRYVEGATCKELADELNSRGVVTTQGNAFTKNSVRAILANEKYIGIYSCMDEEPVEGVIPPLVDKEKFYRAREMAKTNRRAPSRVWDRAEYILSDKIFCGRCGTPMAGESGKGRHGIKYRYYLCGSHKRKLGCTSRAIKQEYLEDFVLRFTLDLLNDDALLKEITDRTWTYYVEKRRDTSREQALQHQLNDVNKAMKNLLRAVEAGFFNDATRIRMEELEGQKAALEAAIAELSLTSGKGVTKDMIEFFLLSLRSQNYADRDCQRRLINVFINSIYVYDDYLILNYNYSNDSRLIRFSEMNELLSSATGPWFESSALLPAVTRTLEPFTIKWFECVFSVNVRPKKKPW